MDQLQSNQLDDLSGKSKPADLLCHDGMVSAVDSGHPGLGKVTILSRSACADCHAKGVCSSFESQEKVLSVHFIDSNLAIGDRVRVMIKESLGWQALVIAMVVPLILLMGSILFFYFVLHLSDTISALIGLGVLAPYYSMLMLFKKRFSKRFIMYAQKI